MFLMAEEITDMPDKAFYYDSADYLMLNDTGYRELTSQSQYLKMEAQIIAVES